MKRRAVESDEASDWEEDSSSSSEDEQTQASASKRQHKRQKVTDQSHTDIGGCDGQDGLCEYERKRLRNIQENMAIIASLNLLKSKENLRAASKKLPKVKREKKPDPASLLPSRRSLRLQRITPEGVLLSQTSTARGSLREEEEKPRWPPRQPSGPLKMTCLSRAMEVQEETFRGEITGLTGQSGAGNLSNQSDRFVQVVDALRIT